MATKDVNPKMHIAAVRREAEVQQLGGGEGKGNPVVSDRGGGWEDGSVGTAQANNHKDLRVIPSTSVKGKYGGLSLQSPCWGGGNRQTLASQYCLLGES